MRSLVIVLFTLMSLAAGAADPTAMGLALRRDADMACEPLDADAKGIYVIIWYNDISNNGFYAEVRSGISTNSYRFNAGPMGTGKKSGEQVYQSEGNSDFTLILDWKRQGSKNVIGPNGTSFRRLSSASISLPEFLQRDGRSPYKLTCLERI